MNMDEDQFNREMMGRAINQSKHSLVDANYRPYGAVVVRNSDKKIISEGCNNVYEMVDPTLHGEIVAIRKACKSLDSLTLKGCTLYTSCEPCPLCVAVIWFTKLDRIFYGNAAKDTLDIFNIEPLLTIVNTPTAQRSHYTQLMADEAQQVFRDWHKLPKKK